MELNSCKSKRQPIRSDDRSHTQIFWLGEHHSTLEPQLSEIYKKIQPLSVESLSTIRGDSQFSVGKVYVMSFDALESEDLNPYIDFLTTVKDAPKFLVIINCADKKLSKNFRELLRIVCFDHILFLPEDESRLQPCLMSAIEEVESHHDDLDLIQSPSERDVTRKISNMKNIVNFVNAASRVSAVEELLDLLRIEMKSFRGLKEPKLAYANNQNQHLLLYYQGAQRAQTILTRTWSQDTELRINDKNDSQYLADVLGRPFAKLLTLPLMLKRKLKNKALRVSAVLFFEHSMGEDQLKDVLKYIRERISAIGITLDRVLLEHDMNETSILWEKTFDGLRDPLAIFDSSGELVRANRSFHQKMSGVTKDELLSDNIRAFDRIYELHSYPISFSQAPQPTHAINYYVDVTTRVKLQKQMIQNEKMAALGHMAGHIAHELNNPLTGIRSLAQVLTSQIEINDRVREDFREIESAAERCQLVIRNLLDFSRPESDSRVVRVAMNEVISKTLPLLKSLISRFEMQLDLTKKNNDIFVEPHLMQQVVFNIINNAAQAMGDTGQLFIETDVDSTHVWLRVRDTGVGIPENIRGSIFDFFFTTKSQGQGTGLGLSICKSIIDRFNGSIEVNSEIQKGSEFIIRLPKAEGDKQ